MGDDLSELLWINPVPVPIQCVDPTAQLVDLAEELIHGPCQLQNIS